MRRQMALIIIMTLIVSLQSFRFAVSEDMVTSQLVNNSIERMEGNGYNTPEEAVLD